MKTKLKNFKTTISCIGVLGLFTSCGSLLEHRTFISEMDKETDGMFVAGRDFRVVSGDSGRTYRTRDEIAGRTPASFSGHSDMSENSLERELAFKEKSLSESEYRDYMAVMPYLETASEKIYYLSLSRSERDFYISSKSERLTPRSMNAYSYAPSSVRSQGDGMGFREGGARGTAEIFTGMGKDEVMSLWGRPMRVDVAGDPRNQNERWSFYEAGRRKQVYFEAGVVHGWVID